jgi:hypothetical protein
MKYEKDQYSKGFSICGLIIAGAFLWWGITGLINFNPSSGWFWSSFIPIGIGIAILLGQIRAIANKKKLRNTVKYEFEANPNATVEDISKNTGISQKDVQAIILDLKMSGELRGVFSTVTGQLKPSSQQSIDNKYCSACGSQVKNVNAQFCDYCGAKLE